MAYPKYIATVCLVMLVSQVGRGEDAIVFNRDIRPILSDKCFHCHGPDDKDREEDLRLDISGGEQGALTPREDYFIIKPGEPEESELWYRITSEYDDERMPPEKSHKKPLTEEEIAVFTKWIEEGGKYEEFWAFVPPEIAPPAKVQDSKWASNPIDNRVMAQLEKKGMKPSAEADKRTLVRRVTFDLTGLPPTMEEIDTFLSDERPDAYERLVDDLLGRSPYGEHMARYWADLVRLGDTNGMHKDFPRDFSTYRDWLIRSFNDNLPFDEFIKYQLAGDLYENPTRDQLIASGFNRLHLIIDKGTALPEESLHKNVVDRVEAFGTTFLGLTVQCAQCHDHKYDPITQKDYYRLYAFFNNFGGAPETVNRPERGLQPPFINLTTPKEEQQLAEFDAREQALDQELSLAKQRNDNSEKWPDAFEKVSVPWIWTDAEGTSKAASFKTTVTLTEKPKAAFARFVGMTEAEVFVNGRSLGRATSLEEPIGAELSSTLVAGENQIRVQAKGKPGFAFLLEYQEGGQDKVVKTGEDWLANDGRGTRWNPAVALHDPEYRSEWTTQVASDDVRQIERAMRQVGVERKAYLETVPAAMIMSERNPPRQAYLLTGGSYEAPTIPVDRGAPEFLPPMKSKDGPYSRMDLAEWLVAPGHPLTARVAVNRFWQQLFGVGLVKTSEDFGAQGEWPSHPELLDELTIRFVESGWDVKRLMREMTLSRAYRQSSDATPEAFREDPENRLLARGSRYRMDAEMIRDQILAVSGLLNRQMYGPSVKPPQPPGLWEMVSMAEPKTYVADTGDDIYRRSLYTYWRRGMPPPQMTILNAPTREFCVTRRERTNTPLQALLLMNEQEYFKAAKEIAKRALQETSDPREGLNLIYEKITSHVPDEQRLKLMEKSLADFFQIYGVSPELTESLTPELANGTFEKRVELSAWTMMTHSLLNMERAKVRR